MPRFDHEFLSSQVRQFVGRAGANIDVDIVSAQGNLTGNFSAHLNKDLCATSRGGLIWQNDTSLPLHPTNAVYFNFAGKSDSWSRYKVDADARSPELNNLHPIKSVVMDNSTGSPAACCNLVDVPFVQYGYMCRQFQPVNGSGVMNVSGAANVLGENGHTYGAIDLNITAPGLSNSTLIDAFIETGTCVNPLSRFMVEGRNAQFHFERSIANSTGMYQYAANPSQSMPMIDASVKSIVVYYGNSSVKLACCDLTLAYTAPPNAPPTSPAATTVKLTTPMPAGATTSPPALTSSSTSMPIDVAPAFAAKPTLLVFLIVLATALF